MDTPKEFPEELLPYLEQLASEDRERLLAEFERDIHVEEARALTGDKLANELERLIAMVKLLSLLKKQEGPEALRLFSDRVGLLPGQLEARLNDLDDIEHIWDAQ